MTPKNGLRDMPIGILKALLCPESSLSAAMEDGGQVAKAHGKHGQTDNGLER